MEVPWAPVSTPPPGACFQRNRRGLGVCVMLLWSGPARQFIALCCCDGKPNSLVLVSAKGGLGTPRKINHMLLTLQHTHSLATAPSYQQLRTHPLTRSESSVLLGLTRTRNLDPLDRHWSLGCQDSSRLLRAGTVSGRRHVPAHTEDAALFLEGTLEQGLEGPCQAAN